MEYFFCEELYMIEDVKILYWDCLEKMHSVTMVYKEDKKAWCFYCKEEILRYKYVVNDILRLNDPLANEYVEDLNGEVWSVISNNIDNNPYIERYSIFESFQKRDKGLVNKSFVLLGKTVNVYTEMEIKSVFGIHALTYICFQPDGNMHMVEECCIGRDNGSDESYTVMFKNTIARTRQYQIDGMWQIRIYVDGRCVINDYFLVKTKESITKFILDFRI